MYVQALILPTNTKGRNIMGYLESIFSFIGDATWGWALIPFLVVIGVFFTLASGFVQFQFFGRMFRVLFPGGQQPEQTHSGVP